MAASLQLEQGSSFGTKIGSHASGQISTGRRPQLFEHVADNRSMYEIEAVAPTGITHRVTARTMKDANIFAQAMGRAPGVVVKVRELRAKRKRLTVRRTPIEGQ